jgi:hypothetical protein
MKPVRTITKIRNGQSLIRSASVPDTIEAVAAQNISWKKKSDRSMRSRMSSALAPTPRFEHRGPKAPRTR